VRLCVRVRLSRCGDGSVAHSCETVVQWGLACNACVVQLMLHCVCSAVDVVVQLKFHCVCSAVDVSLCACNAVDVSLCVQCS